MKPQETNNDISTVDLRMNDSGRGAFVIEKKGERLAEMVIAVGGGNLTVYHTQVDEALKGQGAGSKLLTAMVRYAREKKLKVIPLCPFVHAQFKKHPEQYSDIWNKTWHVK